MEAFRRLRLSSLALVIALVQLLQPVASYARMAADGLLAQEICTPAGMKKVLVDGDGNVRDVPAEASGAHADHCPLCGSAPPVPLETLIDWHVRQTARGALRVGDTCFQSQRTVVRPPSTGPPSGL